MGAICSIIVFCSRSAAANSIAFPLQRHGMEVATSVLREDALDKMKTRFFDLLIVESKINGQSGMAFLAEARRLSPLTMRAIFETEPLDADLRVLVNEAGPCAIFSGAVDPDLIWRLLALEGPVTHTAMPVMLGQSPNSEQLGARNEQLLHENQLLVQEVRRLRQLQKQHIRGGAGTAQAPVGNMAEEAGARVDAAGTADVVGKVCCVLSRMMEDGDITLPVLPVVGIEVQKLLAREDCSFEKIASMVGLEQGMSARILQVANSPVYAGLERIRNLQQAVARLGLRETRNLLLSVVGENLFKTKQQNMVTMMTRLWMHSLCCAYSNENIAVSLQIPESDDYFMMGLLHDVGKLLIIHLGTQAVQKGLITADDFTEDVVRKVMLLNHNALGATLLDKWQYSSIFTEVVSRHNDTFNEVSRLPEPVIVTYFSNMLTRKLGHSLIPDSLDSPDDSLIASALNINEGMLLRLEDTLQGMIDRIKQTYTRGK